MCFEAYVVGLVAQMIGLVVVEIVVVGIVMVGRMVVGILVVDIFAYGSVLPPSGRSVPSSHLNMLNPYVGTSVDELEVQLQGILFLLSRILRVLQYF